MVTEVTDFHPTRTRTAKSSLKEKNFSPTAGRMSCSRKQRSLQALTYQPVLPSIHLETFGSPTSRATTDLAAFRCIGMASRTSMPQLPTASLARLPSPSTANGEHLG